MNYLKNICGRIASLFKRRGDGGDFRYTLNTGFTRDELEDAGIDYSKLDNKSCNFIVQLFPPYDPSSEICPVYVDMYYPVTNSLGTYTIGDINEKKETHIDTDALSKNQYYGAHSGKTGKGAGDYRNIQNHMLHTRGVFLLIGNIKYGKTAQPKGNAVFLCIIYC